MITTIFVLTLVGLFSISNVSAVDTNATIAVWIEQSTAPAPGGAGTVTTNTTKSQAYADTTFGNTASSVLAGIANVLRITNLCSNNDFNPCSPVATCVDVAPSVVKCSCPSGYLQTSSTKTFGTSTLVPDGTNCPDFDECAVNATVCGPQTASCTNLNGNYECTCNFGFEFVSATFSCDDQNECNNASLNNCSTNAVCTDLKPGFNCACKTGFTGDGVTCAELDECSLTGYDCGGAAAGTCSNTVGSYVCTCNSGYTLNSATDPHVCQDNDECTGTPCNANANCTNIPGSFTCACNSGYSGDGITTCTDIDECVGTPCATNAKCINTPGSFTCACNSGFNGDGTTCANINECSTSPCHADATCTDTAGSFTCSCNSGFAGDGIASCIRATSSGVRHKQSVYWILVWLALLFI